MRGNIRTLNNPILVLAAVQLIESLAFALPISFFPNYVVELGASVASVGLFTSSFMMAFAVLSPKIGELTDRYGRKKLMMLGVSGDVILGILTGLVPSWEWLLLIRVFNGAVSSAAILASETLLIDLVSPDRRGEASGLVISAQMIGRNIGPMTGGAIQWFVLGQGLSLIMSYRVPYFVDSLLAFVALIVVYFFIKEPEGRRSGKDVFKGRERLKKGLNLGTPLKILLVNDFVSGVGVGFIIPIMVLFYTDRFDMSPVGIGTIISVSGFIGLFTSIIAGRYSDRIGRKPLIAFGNYVSRLMGLLLPFSPSIPIAGIIVSFRSLGFNIMMPAFRALRADLVPPEIRGRVFGLFGTAFTAGSVIGPIIGTWIYSTYRFTTFNVLGIKVPGYGIPFYINSILGIVTTTFIMLLIKEPRGEEKAPQFAEY
jgi:MFS family permease